MSTSYTTHNPLLSLQEGIKLQLQKGQLNCAQEEAQLLLEAYTKDRLPCEGTAFRRVTDILDAFPPASSARSAAGPAPDAAPSTSDALPTPLRQYKAVAQDALRWARRNGAPREIATDDLHARLGMYLWQGLGVQGLGLVAQHLARAADGVQLGRVLAAAASQAPPTERDLFLLRGLLQVLAACPAPSKQRGLNAYEIHRRLCAADDLMETFGQSMRVPQTPLVNFATLLLEALRHQSRPLVALLRAKYAPSLQRDHDTFEPLLDQIEWAVLGVPLPQGGLGGIFQDVLKMFIGGDDE